MADGFLGRWSQRKQAVREGKPLVEPALTETAPEAKLPEKAAEGAAVGNVEVPDVAAKAPPPTLDEANQLHGDSDFRPFIARDVAPEVRNAAMKKLFADPHYNVMDRLDTYIDDYSQPDPLPLSMLRQMASAKFLNLFEDEPEISPPREDPDDPVMQSVAQSVPDPMPQSISPEPTIEHDNTDLRLQPNDAARSPGVGGGAE